MDRHTLFVIIVTAAVTTTVTVVVGWILNFFKLQIANTVIPKAKTSVGETVLKLTVYIFMFAFTCWGLLRVLHAAGPPTRYDVMWIVVGMFGVCVSFVFILRVFVEIFVEKEMEGYKSAHSN